VNGELFPGRTVTQQEIDNIITEDFSKLTIRRIAYFMSLSIKHAKHSKNLDILPRHLPLIG
jgi:hypothetical protein